MTATATMQLAENSLCLMFHSPFPGAHHSAPFWVLGLAVSTGPGFWTCLFSGLAPVAATVVAAAHPRVAAAHPGPTGAIWRRRDVVRIVGDVALTVDYYLTGLANDVRAGPRRRWVRRSLRIPQTLRQPPPRVK